MPATKQDSRVPQPAGNLLVTVQLDPMTDQRSAIRSAPDLAELARVTRQLISLMTSERMATTWAVSDPAHSAATSLILRSTAENELAILGDATWLGPTAGRTRFARELARRVGQARSAGLSVTSLVPRAALVAQHVDLVTKHRITAIAGTAESSSTRQVPRMVHFGVWEFPVCATVPVRAGWLSSGRWSARRRIRRTVRDAATFHLVIDVPAVTWYGRRAEKSVDWLIRRVAQLRDRGHLQVLTLRQAAARLADTPSPAPQRSILRRAA